MAGLRHITLVFLGAMMLGAAPVHAREGYAAKDDLQLSPDLIELLRAEMRELLTGIRSLPAGIATADWERVAETSARMSASYLLEQRLTPAQKQELGTSLPEHFKRLDATFHLEAGKLEAAAAGHDAQLAAFHCYRLIDTCTACHAIYARSRFPGFTSAEGRTHGH